MVASVEASLKRLKTDRIDLYWVHYADGVTPIEEIVRGFDDLVRAGKILYAGLSDFPAWRVARAATISELRGAVPIAGLQVEHSLVERTTEYELLPMAAALGLGIVGWSPLGGGMLTGKYRKGEKGRAEGFGGKVFQAENSNQRSAILDAVIAIADEVGATPGEIAIAWVAAKGVLPIIGPRTVQQLEGNLAATKIRLSAEQVGRLDTVSAPPPIFPYTLLDDPETGIASSVGNSTCSTRRALPSPDELPSKQIDRLDESPMPSNVPRNSLHVEHVRIICAHSYEEVLAALRAHTPELGSALAKDLRASRTDAIAYHRAHGPKLWLFESRDHGSLLRAEERTAKAVQLEIGNRLTAEMKTPTLTLSTNYEVRSPVALRSLVRKFLSTQFQHHQ